MRRLVVRFAAGALTAIALVAVTGGVADAAPIWVLPGVDAGSVLGPTVQLPTQLLKPIAGLLG